MSSFTLYVAERSGCYKENGIHSLVLRECELQERVPKALIQFWRAEQEPREFRGDASRIKI